MLIVSDRMPKERQLSAKASLKLTLDRLLVASLR